MQVLFDIIFYKFVPRVLVHASFVTNTAFTEIKLMSFAYFIKVLLYNYFYIISDIAEN